MPGAVCPTHGFIYLYFYFTVPQVGPGVNPKHRAKMLALSTAIPHTQLPWFSTCWPVPLSKGVSENALNISHADEHTYALHSMQTSMIPWMCYEAGGAETFRGRF